MATSNKFEIMDHEYYMKRCFELALKGAGYVSPNPLVGSVIVKNGKILAEGWHKKYGAAHGERNAIDNARKKGINLKGTTLYVNLEPCSHFGKTPPCADHIIQHKISKVIIAVKDPNPLVAGKGIKKLREAGIEVTSGVLEEESIELNKFYFKYITTGFPYVTIKAAQTIDGKIADHEFRSKWISSPESRLTVHKLRSVYDAVLVGANTVKHDDPKLNVRDVNGRDPYRIIIDKTLALGTGYNVFKYKDGRTIVITSVNADKQRIKKYISQGISVIPCRVKNGVIDMKDAMKKLAAMNIASILAEGGAYVYGELLKNHLADEILIYIAPKVMGEGITAFKDKRAFQNFMKVNYYTSGSDVLVNLRK